MIIKLYNFNLFFQTSTKSNLQTRDVIHAERGQWSEADGCLLPSHLGILDSSYPKSESGMRKVT